MAIFLRVVRNEFLYFLIFPFRRPHGGNVDIISGSSCHFSQFRRNEAVIPQDRLVHAQFSHFLQDPGAFLIVGADYDDVRVLCLDIGELGGVFRVFGAKGFHIYHLNAQFLHGFLEIFLSRHMLFIVVSIEEGCRFVAQNFVGLLHGLGDILRFRYGIPEDAVSHVGDVFGRYGNFQGWNFCILDDGACCFGFIGSHGADDDGCFILDHFLCGIHGF